MGYFYTELPDEACIRLTTWELTQVHDELKKRYKAGGLVGFDGDQIISIGLRIIDLDQEQAAALYYEIREILDPMFQPVRKYSNMDRRCDEDRDKQADQPNPERTFK